MKKKKLFFLSQTSHKLSIPRFPLMASVPQDKIFFCSEIHGIKLLEQVVIWRYWCFTRSKNAGISLSLGIGWVIFKLLNMKYQINYFKDSLQIFLKFPSYVLKGVKYLFLIFLQNKILLHWTDARFQFGFLGIRSVFLPEF